MTFKATLEDQTLEAQESLERHLWTSDNASFCSELVYCVIMRLNSFLTR